MGGQRLAALVAFLSVAIAGAHPFASFDGHGPRAASDPQNFVRVISPHLNPLDLTVALRSARKGDLAAGIGSASYLARGHWTMLPSSPLPPRMGAAELWTGKQLFVWGGFTKQQIYEQTIPRSYGRSPGGALYSPYTRSWSLLPPSPLAPRTDIAAVWTGKIAVLWGGDHETFGHGSLRVYGDGAAYSPTEHRWRTLPPAPISARLASAVLWTGSRVVVISGLTRPGGLLLNGAAFDPSTWKWSRMPQLLIDHRGLLVSADFVWTGKRLVAFLEYQITTRLTKDSFSLSAYGPVAQLRPGATSWTFLRPAPEWVSTLGATTIWTGSRILVVDATACLPGEKCPGQDDADTVNVFDPTTDSWSRWPPNAVASDAGPVVWTGRALYAMNETMSSSQDNLALGDGVAYDPSSQKWLAVPKIPCSSPGGPTLLWTGESVLYFGLAGAQNWTNCGAILVPSPHP